VGGRGQGRGRGDARGLGRGRGDARGSGDARGQGQGRGGDGINVPVPGQHPAQDAAGRVILLDEKSMQSWGLTLVGFAQFRQGVCDETNTRRFRAYFGVGPKALSELYSDLATLMPKIDIKEFFLTLSWLKLYETESVLAGR
jgi:hypothetical protein